MASGSDSVPHVILLWAVPVLAATVATALVALAARPIGDELGGLAHDLGRLGELRARLAAVRAEVGDSEIRDAVRRQASAASGNGSPAD